MDWGKGILLTIIAFVVMIMTMVVISVRMDGIELVTENYYEEEIKFQNQIDQTNSANELDREVISFDNASKVLELDLPQGTIGSLQIFRPSDASLDQTIRVEVDQEGITSIPLHTFKKGYWRLKLKWAENGVAHYQEKQINI